MALIFSQTRYDPILISPKYLTPPKMGFSTHQPPGLESTLEIHHAYQVGPNPTPGRQRNLGKLVLQLGLPKQRKVSDQSSEVGVSTGGKKLRSCAVLLGRKEERSAAIWSWCVFYKTSSP